MTLCGGIEAGGTKFVCAIGHGPNDIRAEVRFPTTMPGETIGRAIDFFKAQQEIHGPLTAIGIGSFGPLDPDPNSPTFGYITSTPKAGWTNSDFVGRVQKVFAVPIGFDTDVNGAALSEWHWGAAQGLNTFVYLTVGTGIGGGVMVNSRLLHGLIHPELGHIRVPHDRDEDPYKGCCPFHGDCFEGLASGPAISERWDQPAETLASDHPAWELEAHYIALALTNYICTLSPQRIVLGGGVLQQAHLFPMVRQKVPELLNGYVRSPAILKSIDRYIVPPGLGDRSGIFGAIALAQQAVSVSA